VAQKGDVMAQIERCGGSLKEMRGFSRGDVVAKLGGCGGSEGRCSGSVR
jgi:hypothetical protein